MRPSRAAAAAVAKRSERSDATRRTRAMHTHTATASPCTAGATAHATLYTTLYILTLYPCPIPYTLTLPYPSTHSPTSLLSQHFSPATLIASQHTRYARAHPPHSTRARRIGGKGDDRELTQQCTLLLSSIHPRTSLSNWSAPMVSIIRFAERNPKTYLVLCLVISALIRLAMAHGNIHLFFDPLYPVFRR